MLDMRIVRIGTRAKPWAEAIKLTGLLGTRSFPGGFTLRTWRSRVTSTDLDDDVRAGRRSVIYVRREYQAHKVHRELFYARTRYTWFNASVIIVWGEWAAWRRLLEDHGQA